MCFCKNLIYLQEKCLNFSPTKDLRKLLHLDIFALAIREMNINRVAEWESGLSNRVKKRLISQIMYRRDKQ